MGGAGPLANAVPSNALLLKISRYPDLLCIASFTYDGSGRRHRANSINFWVAVLWLVNSIPQTVDQRNPAPLSGCPHTPFPAFSIELDPFVHDKMWPHMFQDLPRSNIKLGDERGEVSSARWCRILPINRTKKIARAFQC